MLASISLVQTVSIFAGLKATHMQHTYDFYKPDMVSEYPMVDGKLSVKCYMNAVDKCYARYMSCLKKQSKVTAHCTGINDFDYFIFHTPFCKIVQKSLGRCMLQDFLNLEGELDENSEKKYKELMRYRFVALVKVLNFSLMPQKFYLTLFL